MQYLRTAIFTTLLLITALVGYMVYTFDGDYQLKQAKEAFLKEEYAQAQRILHELDGTVDLSQLSLARAYVAKAQGDSASTLHYLEKGRGSLTRTQSSTEEEILTLEAHSALVAGNLDELERLLRSRESDTPVLTYMEALLKYRKGNYRSALIALQNPPSAEDLNEWQRRVLDDLVRPAWQHIRIARAQIAVGNYLDARKLLEEETTSFEREDLLDAWFLLGLSHIYEGKERPVSAVGSYYSLAMEYFDRVPVQHPHFGKEREEVIAILKESATEMVEQEAMDQLPLVMRALSNWNAADEINELTFLLLDIALDSVAAGKREQLQELTLLFQRMLPEGAHRDELAERAKSELKKALHERTLYAIAPYWELALGLSSDPAAFTETMIKETEAAVIVAVESDDSTLEVAVPFLTLWDLIERDSQKRFAFAELLIDVAGSLWVGEEPNDQKSLRLLQMAEELPYLTEHRPLKEKAEKVLKVLYKETIHRDQITRLPRLVEGAAIFGLNVSNLQNAADVANQLADAEYLYSQGRYEDARNRLSLLMKVDPQNAGGRRLSGLIAYQMEELEGAHRYLKAVVKADREVNEALAVCEILVGDALMGNHLLNQLEQTKSLEESSGLRLAYGLLLKGRSEQALNRFDKIHNPSSQVWAARLEVAYEGNEWLQVVAAFQELDELYQADATLRLMTVQALAHMERTDEAESVLEGVFRNLESQPTLDPYYENLKKQREEEWNPHLLAVEFYRSAKHDPEKVLYHLGFLQELTAEQRLTRGLSLLEKGKQREARLDLEEAYRELSEERRGDASRHLAQIYSDIGLSVDSFLLWEEYMKAHEGDLLSNRAAAGSARQVKRWDRVAHYLNRIRKEGELADSEKVYLLEAFLKGEQRDEVATLLNSWLGETSDLSLATQLSLAATAAPILSSELIQSLIENNKESELSTEERIAFFKLLMRSGEYDTATALLPEIKGELEKSEEGKRTLIEWLEAQSEGDALLAAAKALADSILQDAELDAMIMRRDPDSVWTELRMRGYMAWSQIETNAITPKLAVAREMIYLALSRAKERNGHYGNAAQEIEKAKSSLESVLVSAADLPEAHALMALALYELGAGEQAIARLRDARRLQPDHTDATRLLATIYREGDKGQQARALLEQESAEYPKNVPLLVLLAEVYEGEGDLLEAKELYQNLVKLRPKDSSIYFSLGKLLMNLQNPEDAWKILGRGIKLEPENEEGLTLLIECLNDETFVMEKRKVPEMTKEEQVTYEKLQRLNPNRAQRLRERFERTAIQ